MSSTTINRGEASAVPFTITDAGNGLANKRVTAAISATLKLVAGVQQVHFATAVMKKVSGLPGSSADVTISSQTAGQISGTINFAIGDFTTLVDTKYAITLWVDSNTGDDRCVTSGGYDDLNIQEAAPRT